MGIIESIVLTVVIGLTVLVVACAVIQRIFDEQRRTADRAEEVIDRLFRKMPDLFDSLIKIEKKKYED